MVNADVWTDYPFSNLPIDPRGQAHLVLVNNPPQHPKGDFTLRDGQVYSSGDARFTFSGIGVYRHELFDGCRHEAFPRAPVLCRAMDRGQVTGELFQGLWSDIGTPERLREIQAGEI